MLGEDLIDVCLMGGSKEGRARLSSAVLSGRTRSNEH